MACIYLTLQGSYKVTELGLFADQECLETSALESGGASAQLAFHIERLLSKRGLSCSDLSFIALNHGPGSFTSLRILCSTVNGMSFASGVPLLEFSGFEVLAHQVYQEALVAGSQHLAILFNAFNDDVYFALYTVDSSGLVLAQPYAYENIDLFLERVSSLRNLCFTGNGAVLHYEKIAARKGVSLVFQYEAASIESLGKSAFFAWKSSKPFTRSISPLYLKLQHYTSKYTIG